MSEFEDRIKALSPEKRELLFRHLQAGRSGAENGLRSLPLDAPRACALSSAQQRLWLVEQFPDVGAAYHLPQAMRLSGPLEIDSLRRALGAIVARHEALRTTFVTENGVPRQIIGQRRPPGTFPLAIDVGPVEEHDLWAQVNAEARRPFDLARGPLFRAHLWRLGPAQHILLLTLHHIVADGWSLDILRRELGAFYSAYKAGIDDVAAAAILQPLPLQYADYAVWQNQWIGTVDWGRQLAYWMKHLADVPPSLDIPRDYVRPTVLTHHGDVFRFSLPTELVEALRALGRETGATLFMVLLAGFQALIARYSYQFDFVLGVPVANRPRVEFEGLIGFFVNILPMRADLHGRPTAHGLIDRVRETALGAYGQQGVPFDKLVDLLRVDRDASRTPLVQVTFQLKNAPQQRLVLDGVHVDWVPMSTGAAHFELGVTCWEDGIHAEIGRAHV